MAFFNFPHTRTYDTDLGWIIKELNTIKEKLSEYLETSVISFADPILWNITTQYPAVTVVIDGATGTAYLSRQPVPAGIPLSNTNYWLPIYNYDAGLTDLRSQIAYNAESNPAPDRDLAAGSLVFWNGILYKTLNDIPAGYAFSENVNITPFTVNERIEELKYYFRPEDFGAVGDNITDDSAAIQRMFDAMNDCDCAIFTAPAYYIASPLTLNKNYIVLSGGYAGGTEYNTRLRSDLTGNQDILTITGVAVCLYNMGVQGAGRGIHLGYAVLFDNDNTIQDGNTDAFIVNCNISTTEKGIGVKGRNLVVRDTLFSGQRYAIDWLQTAITTELRGHIVDSCRFHGVVCAVRNYISNTLPTKGNTIQNNIVDGGGVQLFSGTGGNITILNNTVYLIDSVSGGGNIIELSADQLNSAEHRNVINNNILHLNGKNYAGIFLNNVSAIVMNNYIEDLLRRGIAAAGGANAFISHNIVSKTTAWAYQIEAGSNGIICNNLAIDCPNNAAGGTGSTNNLSYTS